MTAKWSRFAIFFWRPERAFIQPIEPNIVNGRCGQSSAFVDRRSISRSAPVRGHFSAATTSLPPYNDPAFPDRPLVLHAALPRDFDTGTPVLFVHHGVRHNGRDYRDYWLDLVDEAGVLAIPIEFPERSFPDHLWYQFGNLHDQKVRPNPQEEWTFGVVLSAEFLAFTRARKG
jgi:hypothetical protein